MQKVLRLAGCFAAGDAKILITGESGAGKSLVARYIHACSPRADRAFIAVNCAAVDDRTLESELFGHARRRVRRVDQTGPGKLPMAAGGTLFLDEVGEMSRRMQAVLLRFLEDGEIQPVGSAGPGIRVNARLITATSRNLSELVASGRFREDVLYRIQVGRIHVPPLRERVDDVPALIEQMVKRAARPVCFSDRAVAALVAYRWPGNVWELRNVVERAICLSDSDVIEPEFLKFGPMRARSDEARPKRCSRPQQKRRMNRVSDRSSLSCSNIANRAASHSERQSGVSGPSDQVRRHSAADAPPDF